MPVSTIQVGDLHVNVPLTNVSIAYAQSASSFIADKVFPMVGVQNMSGLYWRWPRGTFFRTDAERRAPGTRAARTSFRVEMDAYLTSQYAIGHDIPDERRANADSQFNLDRIATEQVTQQLLLQRELNWASAYFKSGVWGRDVTGVASSPTGNQTLQWDQGSSNPITFIQGEVLTMQERTGIKPNLLIITPYVRKVLANHSLLIDRIRYTGQLYSNRVDIQPGGSRTLEAMLADLFGVDRVMVAESIVNQANEQHDDNNTVLNDNSQGMRFIFGKGAWLGYAAPSASTETPSAGYTFAWTGLLGSSAYGVRVKKYRMEDLSSDSIEGQAYYDQKIVAPELGVYLSNIVA